MSWRAYHESKKVSAGAWDWQSLLFSLLRESGPEQYAKLELAFPQDAAEFERRWDSDGGFLPEERQEAASGEGA